ncbi:MAG: hypothetical protein JWM24_1249, partial [Solirubrobacterales bacterium]|nr:hypothetical protein [Solirubrobacterales bacterium]
MERLRPIVVVALLAALATVGCGGASEARSIVPQGSHFRFFAKASFWNTRLEADQPLDPASAELAAAFAAEVEGEREGGHSPWINTTDYSVPVYTVPRDQPTVRVRLASPYGAPALQAAWRR